MYNNSIEDIMIDKNFNKRKKGNPLLGILIFLIILLVFAIVAYYYFVVNKVSNREMFFNGILNANIDFYVENETYKEIAKKFSNTSFEMDNEITFSTSVKNDDLVQEEIGELDDYSKYLLKWTTIRDIENEENFNELDISYSGNNFLNTKIINNKEAIAIVSDEIVNKYVGLHKNNIIPFLEKLELDSSLIETYEELKAQVSTSKLELDDTIKQAKIEKYKTLLINKLPEEFFIKQENQISLVKENLEEISVEAYKLSLTQEQVNSIIKDILTNFRNDEEFIKKIITNTSITEKSQSEEEITNQEDMNGDLIPSLQPIGNSLEMEDIIPNILLGKKVNATVEEVQTAIDEFINNIDSEEGNGLEITVYVSENATEKISMKLPDESTIDMEFNNISETKKDIVITYLYEEEIINYGEDNMVVYSATENTIPEESQAFTEKQTNGIKVEMSKTNSDASTTTELVYNVIENKEITQKTIVNIKTKGTSTSKNFNNDCVIKYSNNNGEFKANIKNTINFDKLSEIEKLTDEKCLYLDTLNEEELSLTLMSIVQKIQEVYANKKEDLSLIDTNTQSPGITQNEQNREELRNLLVSTIGGQMGDAQARGEAYTIQNLQDLQIQGHIVTVLIVDDIAQVSVDGVKFKIDSNFNLSDA